MRTKGHPLWFVEWLRSPVRSPALFAAFMGTILVGSSHGEPLALHPENPHYFLWRQRPTVLITSGEHYGALLNLEFDFERYFAELHKHGLNHTRTFSGVYREVASSFGITDNPLAPKPSRYICPWQRGDPSTSQNGGYRFDLTRWNPAYFRRLKQLMRSARDHGIVVELTLFCPMYRDELWDVSPMHAKNNVNDIGDFPRTELYTLKHPQMLRIHRSVTRRIVQTVNEFDNLYFEVCNEPYFGGVTMAWQRKIMETIVDTEKQLPKQHLISWNVANGRKKVTNPPPQVSIFNFHYCVPPNTVEMNYGLNKVIGENETGFRGQADILYRTEGWDFMLAGGALYNNLDYSFTAQHPEGGLTEYKSPGGGSRRLRQQLGILKRFVDGLDFINMQPLPEAVVHVMPEMTVHVLAESGNSYAVYLHTPLPSKPKSLNKLRATDVETSVTMQLPSGSYTAEWVDTKTGEIVQRDRFVHDAQQSTDKILASPKFDDDIALRVQKNNASR